MVPGGDGIGNVLGHIASVGVGGLDRDITVIPGLLKCLTYKRAKLLVAGGERCGKAGVLIAGRERHFAQSILRRFPGKLNAAPDKHRTAPCRDGARAFAYDRFGDQHCGDGAVAGEVCRLFTGSAQQDSPGVFGHVGKADGSGGGRALAQKLGSAGITRVQHGLAAGTVGRGDRTHEFAAAGVKLAEGQLTRCDHFFHIHSSIARIDSRIAQDRVARGGDSGLPCPLYYAQSANSPRSFSRTLSAPPQTSSNTS